MRLLQQIWSTPRLWRYIAVGAVAFIFGGVGTAFANQVGLTEIVYNGFVAQVDATGNLLVKDSAANASLTTINTKLNDDSSGNLKVSGPAGTIALQQQFTALANGASLTSLPANTTACHALMAVVQTEQAVNPGSVLVTLELGAGIRYAPSTDVAGTALQNTAEQIVVYFIVPGTMNLPAFAPQASVKIQNQTGGSLDGSMTLLCGS
jgi:hypothetical protein